MSHDTAKRREAPCGQKLFSYLDADCARGARCEYSAFAFGRLQKTARKRWGEPTAAVRRHTLDEYFAFASSLPDLNLSNPVLQRARLLLREWLRYEDWMIEAFRDGMDDGPGTSAGVTAEMFPWLGDLQASRFSKRVGPVTYSTPAVLEEYCAWCLGRPDLARDLADHGATQAYPRLAVVKKNAGVGRTIILFPTADMRLQKGGAAILRRVLARRTGIVLDVDQWCNTTHVGVGSDDTNISDQQRINRRMAFEGSRDHCYATADLKRASDSLCVEALEFLLPEWVVNYVKLFSSPVESGKSIRSRGRIVLDMGNDLTFPLQTMIFAAVCIALLQRSGWRHARNGIEYAVFGDDIIVPTCLFKALQIALHSLGCTVNMEKSFAEGPFRESCGGDYWNGFNATPFYIENLRGRRDVYIATNKLTAWESRTGLSLPQTRAYLRDLLTQNGWWLYVPPYAPEESGVRTWDYDRWLVDEDCGGLISYRGYTTRSRYPKIRQRTFESLRSGMQLMLSGAIRDGKVVGRPKRRQPLVLGTLWGESSAHLATADEYKHLPHAW